MALWYAEFALNSFIVLIYIQYTNLFTIVLVVHAWAAVAEVRFTNMAAAMVKICNDKLEMFNTFSRGCGIKTNVLLKEGDSVISSDPYVVVLRSEFHGEMCDKCLAAKENLSRCSHCKSTYYCGKACQKMAWKFHKLECDYLKKCLTKIPSDTVRLMALFFLRSKENSEHWVKELTTHCEKIRKEKGELFSHFLSSLHTFLDHTLDLNNEEIFQQFCKINCNTFTISNGEMKPVGKFFRLT